MDDELWLTKQQMMAAVGRSARTVDLMVRDGKLERRVDGKRALFRRTAAGVVTLPGNAGAPSDAVALATAIQRNTEALERLIALLDAQRAAEGHPRAIAAASRNPVADSWGVRLLRRLRTQPRGVGPGR